MLIVGQKLWWVPAQKHYPEAQEVTVVKIGRKWATIDLRNYRINIHTLRADGGDYLSPGHCYLDRATYEDERDREALYSSIRQRLGGRCPAGVSLDDLRQAERLLGLGGVG